MTRRVALLSMIGIGLFAGSIQAKAYGSAREYVYVETNIKTPGGNSIAAFTRLDNGQLQQLPGSPFLTGGAGTQYAGVSVGPEDSDQDIVISPDRSLLFAVNSGSDTIAVFHIAANGSLKQVEGSPFPSGGNDPVSLDSRR